MKQIAIFFFRPWLGAGSTTYTAHLFRGLELAGYQPSIYRVLDNSLPIARPFGEYTGVDYRILTLPEAKKIVTAQPSVMSAMCKPPHVRDGVIDELMALGMRPIIHDSGEAASRDWTGTKPICVRQAVTALVPGSVYLPHPYVRSRAPKVPPIPGAAVSIARVAQSKRTEIILQANRMLGQNPIALLGMEDRLYSKELKAEYPDVYARSHRGGIKFPLTFDAPIAQIAGASMHVDMSYFAKDGGGTQYAQLEAMDAGAVNVMHQDWFRFDGDMHSDVHAIAVKDSASLAAAINTDQVTLTQIRKNCEALLTAHDARMVGFLYAKELLGL